ncbi:hypothetical protein ACMXYV_09995 [Neptuniibacter sp. SY11_33]|uniref:hypothetical protein n=1 Tax=Neptuniibacter sp. SY11_33 TaxID=3398215 RepID=UPI0039F473AB
MDFLLGFFSFPLAVTAIPFLFLFSLMLISVLTGFVDDIPFLSTDTDVEIEVDAEVPGGTWLPVGITKVPLIISLTTVSFVATILLYYIDSFILSAMSGAVFYGAASGSILASLFLSLYIAAFLLKPLQPLFDHEKSFAAINYVGMNAVVRSNSVNQTFGEAVVTKGSLENQLDIYSNSDATISYGDEVLIVSLNPENQRYLVIKK